ncbi:MAG: class I SAM-dependent methyltransferase [Oligoflexales bacterium]
MQVDNAIYWNSVAGTKVFATPIPYDALCLRLPLDARILDVGCGHGRALKEFETRGYRNLEGIDCAPKMLEIASSILLPPAKLRIGYAESLPGGSNTFDLVLLVAILTTITDLDEEQKAIDEALRVLRPGGILFVNDMLVSSRGRPYEFFEDRHGRYGRFLVDSKHYVKHCSEERFKALLGKFEIETIDRVEWLSMNGNLDTGVSIICKKPGAS